MSSSVFIQDAVTCCYLVEAAVQRLVLRHELVQKNFKGVDPNFDRRLSPVPLLLSHSFLQDVFKESVQIFVADTFTVVHLRGRQRGQRGRIFICLLFKV